MFPKTADLVVLVSGGSTLFPNKPKLVLATVHTHVEPNTWNRNVCLAQSALNRRPPWRWPPAWQTCDLTCASQVQSGTEWDSKRRFQAIVDPLSTGLRSILGAKLKSSERLRLKARFGVGDASRRLYVRHACPSVANQIDSSSTKASTSHSDNDSFG